VPSDINCLLSTALRPAVAGQDLLRREGPVPQPPGDPATADLDGQIWRWHEHNRAACPRHAVADNAAAGRAPDRAPVSRADHQHITRATGDADQNPAGWPALDLRLHSRLWLRSAPHCRESLAHPLGRHVAPGLHEPGGGLNPRRPVTTWWLPGKDRHKYSVVRESHVLRVSQRCQAARRAANTRNDPDYARHGDRSRWRAGGTGDGRRDARQRPGAAAACRGPLPVETA
jgi:hypothetical protein